MHCAERCGPESGWCSMPHKARAVEAALLRKGFRLVTNGRHRKFEYGALGGNTTAVRTSMSHGANRDLSDDLLGKMARQVRLSRREFDELVRCPMSQSRYEGLLARRGHLPGQA